MPTQPSILLIQTDQQRADTIAALGNPHIQTPTLDSLVAEGVAFTSAYTPSPVCMAARASLLLGQYPHETGCVCNNPMPQERASLMDLLHDAGYQTHGVGKMHFGPDGRKLWGFDSRDFSEEGGLVLGDDFSDSVIAAGYDHIHDPNGVRSEWYYVPQPSQLPERLHHTRWVADRSLDFLARRDPDRPFFLWTSFIKPHPPFESPVPWNRLYKPTEMPFPHLPPGYEELLTYWNRLQNRYKYRDQGQDWNLIRLIRAAYYAAISFLDYHTGRILAQLRDTGALDNTLVIFTSDHGELLGDFGSWGKRSMLDAAARIPMLVRYPERFAAGAICPEPASLVDVLPTCLAGAGLPVPDDRSGADLALLARGEIGREGVVSQYSEGELGLYGYMTREWKYIHSAPDGREWLFPRGTPEQRSLAGNPAYAGILAAMRERLMARFRADGYEAPLEGDDWRPFPPTDIPSDPDALQLFQEGRSAAGMFPPGYEPRCNPEGGFPIRGL